MANSDVDICSQSLALLGVPPINSLADEDDNSVTCNLIYPATKKALLSEHAWRFNMQKEQLARLVVTPDNEWTYAYQLPSDMLSQVFALFESGDVGAPVAKNWERFGNMVFTNYETIWIDYQVEVAEVNFPPYFEQFIVYEMTWKLADSVTEQEEKAAQWRQVARGTADDDGRGGYFATARNLDAKGSPSQGLAGNDFSLVSARVGSTY